MKIGDFVKSNHYAYLRNTYKDFCDEELEDKIKELNEELDRRQKNDIIEYYKDIYAIRIVISNTLSENPEYNDHVIKVHSDGKYDISITWSELLNAIDEILNNLEGE